MAEDTETSRAGVLSLGGITSRIKKAVRREPQSADSLWVANDTDFAQRADYRLWRCCFCRSRPSALSCEWGSKGVFYLAAEGLLDHQLPLVLWASMLMVAGILTSAKRRPWLSEENATFLVGKCDRWLHGALASPSEFSAECGVIKVLVADAVQKLRSNAGTVMTCDQTEAYLYDLEKSLHEADHTWRRGSSVCSTDLNAQKHSMGMLGPFPLEELLNRIHRPLFNARAIIRDAIPGTLDARTKKLLTRAMTLVISLMLGDKLTGGAAYVTKTLSGSMLWVTWPLVGVTLAVYSALLLFHYRFRHRFIALAEGSPRMQNEKVWDFLFFATQGVITVLIVPIAGVLLAYAFLMIPAAIAAMFTRKWAIAVVLGWSVGFIACVMGLTLSYTCNLPYSPTLILSMGAFFIIAVIIRAMMPRIT